MPNKEMNRSQATDAKAVPAVQAAAPTKTVPAAATPKANVVKATLKECSTSPVAPAAHASELLGSLTTLQQQRTSARVIKKLRLEPPAPDPDKRDLAECDTPIKIDDKPLAFPTVKQRMPKALWSADEKSLFFEALNEYGKDFDAITAYICVKMKKKGMPDANLKTKTQVSHFYYRTWHKLSKHVHFGENVKKVAQELYALINYGELRKKLVSVSEKTCARLHEMVLSGSMVVRHRGRNVRARTPMCRALRRLNQITEGGVAPGEPAPALLALRARSAAAWARVAAAAHNPRAAAAPPPRLRLAALLAALERRWRAGAAPRKRKLETLEPDGEEEPQRPEDNEDDLEEHLNLEPDRLIVQEQSLPKKPVLHLGPRATAVIRLPVVRASQQLSSQKICFSSYLQRVYQGDHDAAKIRTPKRHRKDSSTEKEKEIEQKKLKLEDEPKLLDIDETAVDGIELMAHYKTHQDDEEKPSTEDEKEIKSEETAEEEGEREKYLSERDKDSLSERDKDMSEREKDSFSELDDDEKYNKSDSDNESDQKEKGEKEKFKNLKVKFRIRPKKRGGSIYTLVTDKEKYGDEQKTDEQKTDEQKTDEQKIDEQKTDEQKTDDQKTDEQNDEPTDIDVERAVQQIKKGWSVYDAGDLTIGDLYLMFGSRSRLELDYWWAEPTPPLPVERVERLEREGPRGDSSPERRDDGLLSPRHDSNDALSGDERRSEAAALSPEPAVLAVATKLRNRATAPPAPHALSERLKRLLALAGNPHVGGALARCDCGHVCAQARRQGAPKPAFQPRAPPGAVFRHPTPIAPKPTHEAVQAAQAAARASLAGVPRWRRGRPRAADRRVVVQRLLPLLPKLPPPSKLIPVKIVPSSPPAPPRLLPRPPPASDLSFFYVLSESNGQFFFHDGDRRIPITPLNAEHDDEDDIEDETKEEFKMDVAPTDGAGMANAEPTAEPSAEPTEPSEDRNPESGDIANFLPAESLSMSPSRLLASDGWLAGSVQDLSLSSFLGQLEPPLAVDSHLHSLMAESSVDYVAKFADLAAEVTDERGPLT